FFQVAHQFGAQDGEFAAEVLLDEEVLIIRLDAGRGAGDVRDGGGGRDGQDVAVAHALIFDFVAHRGPVHPAAPGHVNLNPPLTLEDLDGVLREQTTIPFGSPVAAVAAAFSRQIAGGAVGKKGDGLHELVVE